MIKADAEGIEILNKGGSFRQNSSSVDTNPS